MPAGRKGGSRFRGSRDLSQLQQEKVASGSSPCSSSNSSCSGVEYMTNTSSLFPSDTTLVARKECSEEEPLAAVAATGRFAALGFLDLPTELQQEIFKYMPFDSIGKIRLVNRRFNELGSTMLNSEFQRLRSLMQSRFQGIKAQMPRRESARRKHPLARESDIIETLHMRLTLLQMTFGKHIERKHCCFFPGEILDEVYRILTYIKATPNLNRAYKVTDELFDLSTMAMEYFKEHVEPTLPEITYFATDFLDYTPSFSASPKTQLSLLEDHSTSSSNCSPVRGRPSSPLLGALKDMPFSSSSPGAVPLNPTVKKRLRRLRESVKKNNGQVMTLKRELKLTQRRMTNQQKQVQELKARFEDYDKKFQTTSRKLSAVLQELSRCKTELQYWRSKSPACTCGKATPVIELNLCGEKWEEPMDDLSHELLDCEEFKPILSDAEAVSGSNSFLPVLVVPACHTPPQENSSSNFLLPIYKEQTIPTERKSVIESPSSTTTSEPPNKPVTRSCKRRLDMDCEMSALPALPPAKMRLLGDPK